MNQLFQSRQSCLTLLKRMNVFRSKLSRQVFGLALSLSLTAVSGSVVSVAQAKEKVDEPAIEAVHHPGSHDCMPPGPPPPGPMFGLPPGPPPPPPLALPLNGVDLTDDQIDKLAQLHLSFKDRFEPSMLKLHSLEDQFRRGLASANINVEELNGLRGKIAAEKANVDSAMSDFAISQAQVLTPGQRQKIKIEMEKFEIRGGFGPHFGPHGPH